MIKNSNEYLKDTYAIKMIVLFKNK